MSKQTSKELADELAALQAKGRAHHHLIGSAPMRSETARPVAQPAPDPLADAQQRMAAAKAAIVPLLAHFEGIDAAHQLLRGGEARTSFYGTSPKELR